MMSNSFIVFKNRAIKNIERISSKAKNQNIIFRPHFKTHQNIEVGELFRQAGISSISVSSLEMASFFANHSWNDILIAFPLDINEIAEIDKLAAKINLKVLITNEVHLKALEELENDLEFMIEVDAGNHRTGINFNNYEEIINLIKKSTKIPKANFAGIMAHFGNSYIARDDSQIVDIGIISMNRLVGLAGKIEKEIDNRIFISIGDTPTASVMNQFPNIHELRPGNFVYYDLMQLQIGSCKLSDVAALMKCSIVSKNKERKQIIIHGGAVHFSKEILDYKGVKTYGHLVEIEGDNWKLSESYLISLSQEHGIIQCVQADFDKYQIGDYVYIVPVHSCLTANLMKDKTILVG